MVLNKISTGNEKLFPKLSLLLTGLVLLAMCGNAQHKMSPNDSLIKYLSDSNSVIEEKLVALALASPEIERVERQNKIVDYQLRAARSQWMNLLTISGNYNEQTFAKQNPNSQVVYPKFFFGFSLPLGTLLSKTQVKAARESVEIGKLSRIETERRLRADVLTKYRLYRSLLEIFAIEARFMTDLQTAVLKAEDNFTKNKIPFESYNAAMRSRSDQEIKLLNMKQQLSSTKLELEKIIGTDFETAIGRR